MCDVKSLKEHFHQCMPLFIALGDEIRLTIIESLTNAAYQSCGGDLSEENLSRHGLNVREITEQTSLSRPAVSHHLKILKNAGLISIRRDGTRNYYYLTISAQAGLSLTDAYNSRYTPSRRAGQSGFHV